VPEGLVHLGYVPGVPDSWCKLGTRSGALNLSSFSFFFLVFQGAGVFFYTILLFFITKFELYNSLAFQKCVMCGVLVLIN